VEPLLSKPADNQRIEAIHVQVRLAGLIQLSEQVEPVAFQPTGGFERYFKLLFRTDVPVAFANEFAQLKGFLFVLALSFDGLI
jgi:hypothetical protein